MNKQIIVFIIAIIILIIVGVFYFFREGEKDVIDIPSTATSESTSETKASTLGTVPDINPSRINPLKNSKTNPFE